MAATNISEVRRRKLSCPGARVLGGVRQCSSLAAAGDSLQVAGSGREFSRQKHVGGSEGFSSWLRLVRRRGELRYFVAEVFVNRWSGKEAAWGMISRQCARLVVASFSRPQTTGSRFRSRVCGQAAIREQRALV